MDFLAPVADLLMDISGVRAVGRSWTVMGSQQLGSVPSVDMAQADATNGKKL